MSNDSAETKAACGESSLTAGLGHTGYDALWLWFSLSYASWLTLPRVLMHEMPDEWQDRMAELLREFDEAWDSEGMPQSLVVARKDNKFTSWPEWLLNYRRPNRSEIERLRSNGQSHRGEGGIAAGGSGGLGGCATRG